MPCLLYTDDLVLCDDSGEDLRAMVGRFVEVCRRRGLKINAGKSKVMVLGGEEGLECEVCVDEMRLEHSSEFKYLGYVLDESGTDEAECCRKVASGTRNAGAIRYLVNARNLQLVCARGFQESLLVAVFMYCPETLIWKEQRSRIWALQMEKIRGLLGIKRMDIFPNSWIRELCGVPKGVDERITEGILRWFSHVERMENDRIAMRVYVGECAGSPSVGRPRKR